MKRRNPLRVLAGRAAWLLAGVALLAAIWGDIPRIGHSWLVHQVDAHPPAGLGLRAYRVELDAHPIEGLERNLSGLTWSAVTGSLFGVINRPPAVVEISSEGTLLRRFPIPSIRDPEGITHVQDELFLVSTERSNSVHWLRIPAAAETLALAGAVELPLGLRSLPNFGLEGISWDEARAELLLGNEKFPKQVLVVSGLTAPGSPSVGPLQVQRWPQSGGLGTLGGDLASLHAHPRTGTLLVLSEASAVLTEYSRDGRVLGTMPLWLGLHGLRRTIPQPEGVTTDGQDRIYLISEPNLLYRFAPAAAL